MIKVFLKAIKHAINGIIAAFQKEQAFKKEIFLFLFLLPIAVIFSKSKLEFLLLISSLTLVLIVELLNTAIEKVADRISLEHHILLGFAKDASAGAVLLSILLAAVVWVIILLF